MDVTLYNLALKTIPIFNGNPNRLHRFLALSDELIQHFITEESTAIQAKIVLNSILNKLEDQAIETVNISGASTWPEIKNVLIQSFGDQRDLNALNRDLVNLRQRNDTPQVFYAKCLQTLNSIVNYIRIHETNENVIEDKIQFFTTQTLRTFLDGLNDPLGPILRTMRPENLPTAYKYMQEEYNIKYTQNNSFINPQHPFTWPTLPTSHNRGFSTQQTNNYSPFGQQLKFGVPSSQNRSNLFGSTASAFGSAPNTFCSAPNTFGSASNAFGSAPGLFGSAPKPSITFGTTSNQPTSIKNNTQPKPISDISHQAENMHLQGNSGFGFQNETSSNQDDSNKDHSNLNQ